MAQTLTKFAKFLRPLGKGHDEIVAIRLHHNTISLAEVQVKTNVIHLENLINLPLARPFDIKQISRQSDMISEATGRIQQKITTGAPLSALFAAEPVFPVALGQLMAVGERTGNMDLMLSSIARYYEEEFTTLVDGLSTIIEPLMIVFVGIMIGVMVVALYLPIFSEGDAIR